MKKKTSTVVLNDFEKEFYTYLGLLSVRFSAMENNLSKILSKLLGNEDDLISLLLIEEKNLHQTIEILKKINRYRDFLPTYMTQLLSQITDVKNTRNLLIHGVWSKPIEYQNDVCCYCNDVRVKFIKTKGNDEESKMWQLNQQTEFKLSYIIQLIHKVQDIIVIEEYMLKKLEEGFD